MATLFGHGTAMQQHSCVLCVLSTQPRHFYVVRLGTVLFCLQVHSTAPPDVCSVALPLMRFTNLHTLRLRFEHSSRNVLSLPLTALAHLRHFTLDASVHGTLDVGAVLAPLTTLTLLHVSSFQIEDRGEFLTALSALADLCLHKVRTLVHPMHAQCSIVYLHRICRPAGPSVPVCGTSRTSMQAYTPPPLEGA